MNRRSFLKFAGLAPVVPGLAIGALKQPPVIEFNELMMNFCMYRLRRHQFLNIDDHIGKEGILSMYVKSAELWERYYFDIEICQPNMEMVNNIKDKELDLPYTFFQNDFKPSILEFNTLIKYKNNYINQVKIINLQIELHTDSPMMEINRS